MDEMEKVIKLILIAAGIIVLFGCSSRFACEYMVMTKKMIEEISEIPDSAESASIQNKDKN
jgi:hypothetical protein